MDDENSRDCDVNVRVILRLHSQRLPLPGNDLPPVSELQSDASDTTRWSSVAGARDEVSDAAVSINHRVVAAPPFQPRATHRCQLRSYCFVSRKTSPLGQRCLVVGCYPAPPWYRGGPATRAYPLYGADDRSSPRMGCICLSISEVSVGWTFRVNMYRGQVIVPEVPRSTNGTR